MTEQITIIGGGVIGCFLAYRLSLEGASITLLEKDSTGAGASGVSAGNVQPVTGDNIAFESKFGGREPGHLPEILAFDKGRERRRF